MTYPLSRSKDINPPFIKRIHEIDLIRGILIILVVMDHLFYCFYNYGYTWYRITNNRFFLDMCNAFGFYWNHDARLIVRYIVLFLFAFISGMSISFSRNSWKRSWLLTIFWLALAIITNIASTIPFFQGGGNIYIDFNILAVLAISSLVYSIFAKSSLKMYVLCVLVGFLFWWYIIPPLEKQYGYIYFPPFWDPKYSGKEQADWLPLFPYFMFYFLGVICCRILYKDKKSLLPRFEVERPICFLGRHTLLVYLLGSGGVLAISELITICLKNFYV